MSEEKPKKEEAEEKVELESPGTMRVFDPFLFLIGNRNAILRIAATPWALLVGAIFVVSAGVARNYDHHVLTQEWIWVGGPFIASFLTTIFVYVWVWTGLRLHQFKKTENSPVFLSLVSLRDDRPKIYPAWQERFEGNVFFSRPKTSVSMI